MNALLAHADENVSENIKREITHSQRHNNKNLPTTGQCVKVGATS